MLDGIRDLLAGTLQANLAQVSVRQNDDVREDLRLGRHRRRAHRDRRHLRHELPEHAGASVARGYPAALLLMLTICGYLYYRFKRSGWL